VAHASEADDESGVEGLLVVAVRVSWRTWMLLFHLLMHERLVAGNNVYVGIFI
jgi:hypothetical protein